MSDQRMPFQRLDSYVAARELARRVHAAKIRDAALALLKKLNWHGVAMVEFRQRPNGDPVFLEVNGRFWNSLPLACYAGADFPAMLAKIADFYEEEVDVAVASMTSLIEPIMMVFLGTVIGGMVIAMYLPIFEMAGNMKAG